jgi:cardiolipin synthase (CMP-forming)
VLQHRMTWALVVLVIAGITDMLDGFIARRGHQQTTLGAMLDPMADKILMTSAYVALTWASGLIVTIPIWLTVVTLSRDAIILVSVVIINMTVGRRVFFPSWLGKLTTVSHLVTVGTVLLLNVLAVPFRPVRYLFLLTLLLTVSSALHYVYLASTGPSLAKPPAATPVVSPE